MKPGDIVKSKENKENGTGKVLDIEGKYTPWGEYYIAIEWSDGTIVYKPIKWLEVISESR